MWRQTYKFYYFDTFNTFAKLSSLSHRYFNLHLWVIYDLEVLIPFMLFEAEFLAIVNVFPSHITTNI